MNSFFNFQYLFPSDPRKELKFKKHNPMYGTHLKYTRVSGNHLIHLQSSDMEYDVGQSTLPLIDGIPVMTNPSSPLTGIGLYHKSTPKFAGFISLQVYSLPYKNYLKELLRTYKPGTLFDEW